MQGPWCLVRGVKQPLGPWVGRPGFVQSWALALPSPLTLRSGLMAIDKHECGNERMALAPAIPPWLKVRIENHSPHSTSSSSQAGNSAPALSSGVWG